MFHSIRWRILVPFILLILLVALGIGAAIFLTLSRYAGENPDFDIKTIQVQVLEAIILITLIAVSAVIILTHKTIRPIKELIEHIENLAQDANLNVSNLHSNDEIGKSQRLLHLLADKIESQKRELSQERAYKTVVLKEMSDGVVIVNREGQISTVNDSISNLFAVYPEKVIGKTLAEGFRNHQLVELWRRSLDTNLPQISLIEIPSKQLYLQSVAIPLDPPLQGNTLLLLQNLTRQRYLETIRRDFISNISHELRTPLASLKALTETLQDGALEDLATARRFLQLIQAEVDALSQMVTELLELSKLESGRVPLKMQPISPGEILLTALERLQVQAERAGLTINLETPGDLPLILADPQRIEQVIVNLLHNAIKFTPSGGQIILGARPSQLSEFDLGRVQSDTGNMVAGALFYVQDTGQGIPAHELSRIFERFYKIDRARSGGGSGLGLAIARHTVEAHGGKIWAESIEGKGSTFYFFIPST